MHANDNRSYAHCCCFDQIASFELRFLNSFSTQVSLSIHAREEGWGVDYKHSRPQILLLTMEVLSSQLGPIF